MHLNLEHKNPCVASFEFDGSKILDLMEKNKTSIITASNNEYGFGFDNEYLRPRLDYDVEGFQEAMDPLNKYLESIKHEAVELLINNSDTKEWPRGVSESISKELYLYTNPFIYRPGFYMQSHKDNRCSVIAGCLNLEENDNVTFFSREWEGEEIFRCSGTKNKGYMWLNTDDGYHTVDAIVRERKVVIFNFVFALF